MNDRVIHHPESERLLHHIHLLDTVAVRLQNEALSGLGLTVQQTIALRQIYICETVGSVATQKDIERFLRATNPTVTGLLQGLERKGLIRRQTDPVDMRQKRLTVTTEGQALMEAGTKVLHQMESRITRNMEPKEITQLQALLIRALDNLDSL